ncbi:uncharacterized protein LOC144428284 [Styela clava]
MYIHLIYCSKYKFGNRMFNMMTPRNFLLCTFAVLLCMVNGGYCQDNADDLPNWLVGVISVCVFLVLAFAFMAINYYYCDKLFLEDDDEFDEEDEELGYENHVHEIEDDMPKTKIEGNSTSRQSSDEEEEHEYAQVKNAAVPNVYEAPVKKEELPPLDDVMTTAL